MGKCTEEDLLISVDLCSGSYCNGAYRGPSNMRLAAETVCDAKDCRFHFFATGYIVAGKGIIYNYGSFAMSSGWGEFGL